MLPRVIVHNGLSVDGRLDWFTGDIGLYYALAARLEAGAILSGSETILAGLSLSDFDLEAEEETWAAQEDADDDRQLMVVVDSRGRLRELHRLKVTPYWRDTFVLCSSTTPPEYLDYLRQHQFETIQVGKDNVDLRQALKALKRDYGISTIRVDSGGILNGVLLRAGLVDEVSLLISPTLVGGTSPGSFFTAPDIDSFDQVIPLKLNHVEELQDGNLWLRYEVRK